MTALPKRKTVFLPLCLLCGTALAAEKPDVLFIVVDTLRRDHVTCYGYPRKTTPMLDEAAADGGRFATAVAASGWTMPSLMSMFTSVDPSVHGAVTHERKLADGLTTLAEEFRRNGYQTIGITSNPSAHGKFGFNRGFELYDDFTILLDPGLDLLADDPQRQGAHLRCTGEQVTRLAVSWLSFRRDKSRPLFLHLLYFDPHYDYLPPSPYREMFTDPGYNGEQTGEGIKGLGNALSREDREHLIGLYDGEVRYTDDQIRGVLEELKRQGRYDDTLVVIASDHGDEFWEHGGTAHGHSLYDELVLVPLIMRYPKRVPRGLVVGQQVAHVDVMPTILDLAGLPVPAQCVGHSLVPLLAGETTNMPPQPAFLESEIDGHLRGARTPKQKVIERDNGRTRECFSLEDDPSEKRNLCGTPREGEFAALEGRLQEWRALVSRKAEEPAPSAGGKPDLDPELLRQLRSLKYVR